MVIVADEPDALRRRHRPRARRRGPRRARADEGAARAARHARRHRADLRPGLRHREAPPAQARQDGRRRPSGCSSTRWSAKAAATARRPRNCVSVEPLNTEFGRKRQINQSTCNQDYSCLDGFCPSLHHPGGRRERRTAQAMPALTADSTPAAGRSSRWKGVRNIVFTGVGGTGVTTVASILAMAAHVDGRAASVVDMTGLAQKGGAVFSHVRIGETEDTVVGGRVPAASADVLIACDLLVGGRRRRAGALRQGPHRGVRQRRLRAHRRLRHRPRRALRRRRPGPADRGGHQDLRRRPGPATWPRPSWATPSTPT